LEGFSKYAVEIGSGATIYIPSFIKIGFQTLMGRGGGEVSQDSMVIA
jgi:hypothetical protein